MDTGPILYRQAVLAESWRLASLVDRDPFSRTRGSLSRTHWSWKFEDFPFPRLQEGLYALAHLYDLPGEDNVFHQRQDVSRWIEWGLDYWASQQHANGAFDEAYPFEQCLAATAFTSFYVGQAFVRHREHLPAALESRVLDALGRAGNWLVDNDETHGILSNHLAVAVAALELISRTAGDKRHAERAREFLQRILAHQSDEGWMKEYDGADIGYGTHGFFYLASYWQMTGCEETLAALRRFAQFLSYFVHPDGTIGGEYSSRNTEFYYPAGFEMLAGECPASAGIAMRMRQSIAERRVCGVWAMDLFNFMPMLNNLLFAMDASKEELPAEPVACERAPFSKYFSECGLWVINRERHYVVVGLSKGGTVSLFDKQQQRLAARHAGLVAIDGKRHFTSQDYTLAPAVEWSDGQQTATLTVPWRSMDQTLFSPLLFVGFRLFNMTIGRIPAASRALKRLLVRVLIRRRRRPTITHTRTLRVDADTVRIEDDITVPSSVDSLVVAAQFASIHMGSSLYADIRAVENSTSTTTFACRDRIRLTATLGPAGAQWRMDTD
ncbi:MAG: hypothetical protein HKO55_02110 [Gammaproteobacteria bacterium]|nr:hypothetical protein [Gammaproteobacteria bacterium]